MNKECAHIAEEIGNTFEGDAGYGDSVETILKGVTAERAAAHPIPSAHSIWELVLHAGVWAQAAIDSLGGAPMPDFPMPPERDFPPVTDASERAWQQAVRQLFEIHRNLCSAIRSFADERLDEAVPGRSYTFHHLIQGMALHAVYHAGQIALLKKAQA